MIASTIAEYRLDTRVKALIDKHQADEIRSKAK